MLRETFYAMGTRVELLLDAPDGPVARRALAGARREIGRLERVFSRFRAGSELSALNRRRRMRVGPDMARVLGAALDLRARTGGRFDPAVGAAVIGAGYDRSFAELGHDPRPPAPVRGGGAIDLDPVDGRVELGPGVRLDLGAVAKGDAADRARDVLAPTGPCLANVGGDVAAAGRPRAPGRWASRRPAGSCRWPWGVGAWPPRGSTGAAGAGEDAPPTTSSTRAPGPPRTPIWSAPRPSPPRRPRPTPWPRR